MTSSLGNLKAGWRIFLATVKGLEERARNYYSEVVTLDNDSFVEMMVLDGCFIVEYLRKARRCCWEEKMISQFNQHGQEQEHYILTRS